MALGPRAKKAAKEAAVRSDLKQCVVAINIYMTDNDNRYPLSMTSFRGKLPQAEPTFSQDHYGAPGGYYTPYSYDVRYMERTFNFKYKFDSTKHPVVKALFMQRDRGQFPDNFMVRPGEYQWMDLVGHSELLSGFLDGHVNWTPYWEPYEAESSFYAGTKVPIGYVEPDPTS